MKLPGGGAFDRQMLRQLQKLQDDVEAAQRELASMRIEASAGGGAVTAVASGSGELLEVRISPEVVDPKDVEMLEDLVLAAVRESLEKAHKAQEEKMSGLAGGLGLPGLL